MTYVVTGAAAGTRRTGSSDFTAVSFPWHHFVEIGVFADRLELRAVNQDLRVADEDVLTAVPTLEGPIAPGDGDLRPWRPGPAKR